MFLGEKCQKFSFFPLSSYTRAKSWKYVFISTSNGYNSKKKEREFVVHIFLNYHLSEMYHLALVPARNMQVTRFRDSVAISCQNRDKFKPLLLACLTRETSETWHV